MNRRGGSESKISGLALKKQLFLHLTKILLDNFREKCRENRQKHTHREVTSKGHCHQEGTQKTHKIMKINTQETKTQTKSETEETAKR